MELWSTASATQIHDAEGVKNSVAVIILDDIVSYRLEGGCVDLLCEGQLGNRHRVFD